MRDADKHASCSRLFLYEGSEQSAKRTFQDGHRRVMTAENEQLVLMRWIKRELERYVDRTERLIECVGHLGMELVGGTTTLLT